MTMIAGRGDFSDASGRERSVMNGWGISMVVSMVVKNLG